MPVGDPRTAPQRPELDFLRRRSRPRAPAAVPTRPAAAAPTTGTVPPIDYTHHASARTHPAPPPQPAPAPPAPRATGGAPPPPRIDFSRPDRHPAGAPATPSTPAVPAAARPPAAPATPAASARTAGPVDYHRPGPASGTLDLSDPPAAAAVRSAAPPPEALPRFRGPRVAAGEQLLLGPDTPAVTLTRVQSGVGRLTVQAVCSPDVGDLRLGALYQLRSGGTSTVQLAGGNRFAPSARRPVIVASHEEYEQLAIDLRQIRDLERIGVYAFSESRAPLTWGGTLVVTTFGGARIELPLETLAPAAVAVLVSIYNMAGEIVVRTEMETVPGDVREAARAYGYDRITWRDDRTPVD